MAKGVISKEQAARTCKRVWTYANQDPDDPETWYGKGGIMIEMYQSQEQWDNRQAPKIHEAFSQIWGKEELRVSRDRASINPPALDEATARNSQVAFGLHFDTGFAQQHVAEAKKQRPIPKGVQGVLTYTGTEENQKLSKFLNWTGDLSQSLLELDRCAVPGGYPGRERRFHLRARYASTRGRVARHVAGRRAAKRDVTAEERKRCAGRVVGVKDKAHPSEGGRSNNLGHPAASLRCKQRGRRTAGRTVRT